jgi:hypothetical protein
VDKWAKRTGVNRSEAIRRLIDIALSGLDGSRQRSPKARAKSHELASTHLDKLIDPSAPEEERKQRKRRLLKGPKEFWDLRDAARSRKD